MWVKKIIAYVLAFLGIAVLVLSTSKGLSEDIGNRREYIGNREFWWAQQSGKWGDLTSMSYLDQVARFCEHRSYNFDKVPEGDKNIDLYLYGDSYVMEIPKEAFHHLDTFVFHYRYDDRDYSINHAKRNILILKLSERFIRERFRSPSLLSNFRVNGNTSNFPAAQKKPKKAEVDSPFSIRSLFNPHINQNLEYHLFNYNFLIAPRQLKAVLNYKLFNRASGDVVISDDGKYLFYKMTVTQNNICSSYDPLGEREVSTIVASLDTIYDNYKRAGFAEIYFSAIPNPVSILQPGPYNNLIPLIQDDPKLKMPFIDLYTIFKQAKDPAILYRAGDTHWNNNGLQIWLHDVNDILNRESKKQ